MRLSYSKTIYRGIPLKFKNMPLSVSAMRHNELKFLEQKFLDIFGNELFKYYKNKVRVSSPIPFFKNIGNLSAWAWFLSSINIFIEIQKNPSIIKPLQHSSVITVFENWAKIDECELPQAIYSITCTIFEDNKNFDYFTKQMMSNSEVSYMVYGLEYFQHLNYDLRGDLLYNPFPTMVMDWTEDITVADSFSNSDDLAGIILSINYDKYKQLLYDEWYPFMMSVDIASSMPGFTPYFDYHSLFSKKNVNMQNQKGVILFWPWNYTIDELEKNEIGQKLEFKKIHIF